MLHKECYASKKNGAASRSRVLPLKIKNSMHVKYNLPLETLKTCLKCEKNIYFNIAIFSLAFHTPVLCICHIYSTNNFEQTIEIRSTLKRIKIKIEKLQHGSYLCLHQD